MYTHATDENNQQNRIKLPTLSPEAFNGPKIIFSQNAPTLKFISPQTRHDNLEKEIQNFVAVNKNNENLIQSNREIACQVDALVKHLTGLKNENAVFKNESVDLKILIEEMQSMKKVIQEMKNESNSKESNQQVDVQEVKKTLKKRKKTMKLSPCMQFFLYLLGVYPDE